MGYKMKAVFSKKGDMRFISHLDLVRLFQRASRRAGLPVEMTGGFNPHLRVSIVRALKLGLESDAEEAVFRMERRIEPGDFVTDINRNLPSGIIFTDAKETV